MMDDAAKLATAKQYLRRTYASNLAGLVALATTLAATAFDAVTITGNQFEGNQAQGQLIFPRLMYLQAVEEMIAELDPSARIPPSTTFFPDHSLHAVEL